MPLTAADIRALKPKEKAYKATDAHGLYVLVPTSGNLSWRWDFSHNGKRDTLVIGYPATMKADEARFRLGLARRMLREGRNPKQSPELAHEGSRASRNGDGTPPFGEVADAFLRRREAGTYRENTMRRDRYFLQSATKAFEGRSLGSITKRDLNRLLNAEEEAGNVYKPKRMKELLTAVFKYAAQAELIDSNPTADWHYEFVKHKPKPMPALNKPDEVGKMLAALWGYTGAPSTALALRFLVYTMVRPSEARMARWQDISGPVWTVPDEHHKQGHEFPAHLSPQSLVVLDQARQWLGGAEEGWVFPSRNKDNCPISDRGFAKPLHALGYKGTQSLHGLRSTAGTMLAKEGHSPMLIAQALSHETMNPVTRRYVREQNWAPYKAMLDDWARIVDALRTQP